MTIDEVNTEAGIVKAYGLRARWKAERKGLRVYLDEPAGSRQCLFWDWDYEGGALHKYDGSKYQWKFERNLKDIEDMASFIKSKYLK